MVTFLFTLNDNFLLLILFLLLLSPPPPPSPFTPPPPLLFLLLIVIMIMTIMLLLLMMIIIIIIFFFFFLFFLLFFFRLFFFFSFFCFFFFFFLFFLPCPISSQETTEAIDSIQRGRHWQITFLLSMLFLASFAAYPTTYFCHFLCVSLLFNSFFLFVLMRINDRSDFKKKVQVGKDQEKAQSEKDSHSKNRGG